MWRVVAVAGLVSLMAVPALSQTQQQPDPEKAPGKNQSPPRSERNKEARESSSRTTQIDISPPKDDAKNHPFSASAVADAESDASGDVQEFRPYDPHRALKSIEVGDFYFKRKNYRAALDRYQEALEFKPNDALANFRMAQCFEKLETPDEAADHYEQYLKVLPQGQFAEEARRSLERLNKAAAGQASTKEINSTKDAKGPEGNP